MMHHYCPVNLSYLAVFSRFGWMLAGNFVTPLIWFVIFGEVGLYLGLFGIVAAFLWAQCIDKGGLRGK